MQGQRNQPEAQRVDPFPKAVIALDSRCSRRP